jgi:hypothetical protein
MDRRETDESSYGQHALKTSEGVHISGFVMERTRCRQSRRHGETPYRGCGNSASRPRYRQLRHGVATHVPTRTPAGSHLGQTRRDVQSAIEFDTARNLWNTPGMRFTQITKHRTPQTLLLDHGMHPSVAPSTATYCRDNKNYAARNTTIARYSTFPPT